MIVRMELSRILIRELNDYQIIELREIGGERTFPIVIGLPEAQAIERRLRGVEIRRPQTHELLSNVIEAFGGELQSITINDLADHTFYATLDITRADCELIHIDSRPSDAIALGIAHGVPILVEEHVLDEAEATEE
ncbi:MAG: bifunctional nuclease family protein [Planctomycetota bacterium]